MRGNIIIPNFYPPEWYGDSAITTEDLGWPSSIKRDARSDYPEAIFRYVVEILGLNILFYWTRDNNWYTIETEKDPIEVRCLDKNPHWNGKYEYFKSGKDGGPQTNSPGKVIATFSESIQLWNGLIINGVPIGQVLEESVITDLD